MRRLSILALILAGFANLASAGLVVTATKQATSPTAGFDSIVFKLSGFTGADATPPDPSQFGGNVQSLLGINGTWTVTGGAISLPGANLGQASANTKLGFQGDDSVIGTPRSFVNFENNTDMQLTGWTTANKTSAALSGAWYTTGDSLPPGDPANVDPVGGSNATRLTPVDQYPPPDNTFDQTLLARMLITTGSTITFNGTYSTYNSVNAPVTFSFGAVVPTVDKAAITVTPATGTSRTTNDTVVVANAAAVPPNTRENAIISAVTLTQPTGTPAGNASPFGVTGIAAGNVPAGASQTGAVTFNKAGYLNNATVTGTYSFAVNGETAGAAGAGTYNYPLTATVIGNTGAGVANVAAAGSYANLSGTSVATREGTGPGQLLGSTALIPAGTNTGASPVTVGMTWTARNANEITRGTPGGAASSPPLPAFASALTSDKVALTGIPAGQPFVLQMTYDPALFTGTEAEAASRGIIQVVSLNGQGLWENAVVGNTGNTATPAQRNVQGSWAGSGVGLTLGAWGVDQANNVAWAVVNHTGSFATVPEPSTMALAGLGLIGLVGYLRRRGR